MNQVYFFRLFLITQFSKRGNPRWKLLFLKMQGNSSQLEKKKPVDYLKRTCSVGTIECHVLQHESIQNDNFD